MGLKSPLAHGLMVVIWSLALLGIIFKLVFIHRFKVLSVVTYLLMGWLSLIVIYQLAIKLAPGGLWLLAVGGIIYTLGVIFMWRSVFHTTTPSGMALFWAAASATFSDLPLYTEALKGGLKAAFYFSDRLFRQRVGQRLNSQFAALVALHA